MRYVHIGFLSILALLFLGCAFGKQPTEEHPRNSPGWNMCGSIGGIASPYDNVCWTPTWMPKNADEVHLEFIAEFGLCFMNAPRGKEHRAHIAECMRARGWMNTTLDGLPRQAHVPEGNL